MITKFKLYENKYENNDIFNAVKFLDIDTLKDYLKNGGDVNIIDWENNDNLLFTLIYNTYIIYYNEEKIFQICDLLLKYKIDYNYNDYSDTSLILSVKWNKFKCFEKLLKLPHINKDGILKSFIDSEIKKFEYLKKNLKKLITEYNININETFDDIPILHSIVYNYNATIEKKYKKIYLNFLYLFIEHGADWNIKDIQKTYFIDFLHNDTKKKLIKKYPDKYEKFLREKNLDKFNI